MTIPPVLDASPTTRLFASTSHSAPARRHPERTTVLSARTAALDQRPADEPALVGVQEVVRLTGLPKHTLRWYERVGLLPGVRRSPSGHRCYTQFHLRWIAVLRTLRATGMPVATLQELTRLHLAGGDPVELVRAHRTQVLAVLLRLQAGLAALDEVERRLTEHPAPLTTPHETS